MFSSSEEAVEDTLEGRLVCPSDVTTKMKRLASHKETKFHVMYKLSLYIIDIEKTDIKKVAAENFEVPEEERNGNDK